MSFNQEHCENNCQFENCYIDERCALAAIVQSVAMQEAALANVLCAESEKMKKAICMANCIDELTTINESVAQTICTINELEANLKEKACLAIAQLKELRCKKYC